MPEGDTVHRAARRLAEALESRAVLRSDVRVPQHATVDLSGEVVDSVVARGKHLLMRIGPSVVHSHLKMEGSWHVYRPGTRWRRPAFEARMVLDVAPGGGDAHGWQAVGFALGELDIVPRDREEELVGHLGPDPLGDDWNREEALRRLTADPTRPLGLALLDQRGVAGLGIDYRRHASRASPLGRAPRPGTLPSVWNPRAAGNPRRGRPDRAHHVVLPAVPELRARRISWPYSSAARAPLGRQATMRRLAAAVRATTPAMLSGSASICATRGTTKVLGS